MELPAIIIYQLKPLGIYTESSIPYVWLGSELVSSHMVKCLKSFRGIRGVSEPIQTSQMEHSARIIYGLKPLTMFVESSIPEVRLSFWIGLFTYGLVTEGEKKMFLNETNMLQTSLAKSAWAIWFPFSYICFEGVNGGAHMHFSD